MTHGRSRVSAIIRQRTNGRASAFAATAAAAGVTRMAFGNDSEQCLSTGDEFHIPTRRRASFHQFGAPFADRWSAVRNDVRH